MRHIKTIRPVDTMSTCPRTRRTPTTRCGMPAAAERASFPGRGREVKVCLSPARKKPVCPLWWSLVFRGCV